MARVYSTFQKIAVALAMALSLWMLPLGAHAARTDALWDFPTGASYIKPNATANGADIFIYGTNHYINFGTLTGTSGYGIRDNGGTIECKNSGGSWTSCSGGGGGGSPAGNNGDVQYKSGANFSGAATTTQSGTGVISVSNSPVVIGASPSVISLTGGSAGQVLAWLNGIPTWTATTTLSTISGLLNLATQVSGTLGVTNGGTASTTPLGGILVGNGSSAIKSLAIGANLSFDGTTLSATGGGGTGNGNVATSTTETAGQLSYWTSTGATPATLGKVATTSVTCSGTVSCTSFTGIGASPITITGSSGTAASSTLLTDSNTFSGGSGNATTTFSQGLKVTATGNVSASVSAGGIFTGNNTLNDGAGMVWTTAHGSGATGRLAVFNCTNSAFDDNCVQFQGNGTQSVINVLGATPGKGTVKIGPLAGAVSDNNSSGLSIDCFSNSYQGQCLFLKGNSATTTPILSILDSGSNTAFKVDGNRLTTFINGSSTQLSVSGNTYLTGLSAGVLYVGSGSIVNTAASSSIFGYTPLNPTRALTIAGTANQITSSAGSQDLSADRTWTLSLPAALQFPLSFTSTYGTTTYASSTALTATRLYSTNATTTSSYVTGLPSALVTTDNAGQLIGTSSLGIAYGGTGSSTSLGGILAGNGFGAIKSVVIGANLTWNGTTLSATGGSASTTLLSDSNTFSGSNSFTKSMTVSVSGTAGAALTTGINVTNANTSTGNAVNTGNVGIFSQMDDGASGTSGMVAAFGTYAVNRGSGTAIGTYGIDYGGLGTGDKFGIIGRTTAVTGATSNYAGGYFDVTNAFDVTAPTLNTKAALIADNNGISGVDIFNARISGTAKFIIRDTGNVGIGTSTPQRTLTVSSSTAPQIMLTDGSTNAPFNLRAIAGSFYIGTSSATSFATGTPAFYINANAGAVIPALASASGSNCLQVSTTGLISNTGSACGAGGGAAYPFTPSTSAGIAVSATSTAIQDTHPGLGIDVANTSWYGIGGQTLAYASSTNGATIFGLNAGGDTATTSATNYGMTAIGNGALGKHTTGLFDTAIGTNALANNAYSHNNTAIGFEALKVNTDGGSDIAIGSGALANNTSGSNNTAIGGANALVNNTGGSGNTAIGNSTLVLNTAGGNNVAIGFDALYSTTGDNNLGLGTEAGHYLSDGSTGNTPTNSTYLGINTRGSASSATNETVIGYTAFGNGDNSVTIGSTTVTKTILNGKVGIGTTSPWGILSIASNTPSGIPLFSVATSTNGLGGFNIYATSSELTANLPGTNVPTSGMRLVVGALNYYGMAPLDQLFVNGRFNTGDTSYYDCSIGPLTALTATNVNAACGTGWALNVTSSGSSSFGNVSTDINARIDLVPGASTGNNTTVYMGGGNFMYVGSSTPAMEANVGQRAAHGEAIFGVADAISASFYPNGCYFIATTTGNWFGMCKNGTATSTFDTGITQSDANYARLRVEVDGSIARFYKQSAGNNLSQIGTVVGTAQGLPLPTQKLRPFLASYNFDGFNNGFSFTILKLWFRRSLYAN